MRRQEEHGTDASEAIREGQRRVNLVWEYTQSMIAVMVTMATLFTAARLSIYGQQSDAAFLLLSNGFFLVIGFYFGRTNHIRTGGPGGARVERTR